MPHSITTNEHQIKPKTANSYAHVSHLFHHHPNAVYQDFLEGITTEQTSEIKILEKSWTAL